MRKAVFTGAVIIMLGVVAKKTYFKKKAGTKEMAYQHIITVTGNTRNIEGKAAVVTDSSTVYFLEGVQEWDSAWLNHPVRVTGDLLNRNSNGPNRPENLQRSSDEKFIHAALVMKLEYELLHNY